MCDNIKNVEIVKKSYLQALSLLFLLSLLDHHLGQQGQELLCSPSRPGVRVRLQGQHHFSDASWGAMPSECQQQDTHHSCEHEPSSILCALESGAGDSGKLAHCDCCTVTFKIRFFPAKFFFCSH